LAVTTALPAATAADQFDHDADLRISQDRTHGFDPLGPGQSLPGFGIGLLGQHVANLEPQPGPLGEKIGVLGQQPNHAAADRAATEQGYGDSLHSRSQKQNLPADYADFADSKRRNRNKNRRTQKDSSEFRKPLPSVSIFILVILRWLEPIADSAVPLSTVSQFLDFLWGKHKTRWWFFHRFATNHEEVTEKAIQGLAQWNWVFFR
jgi:hypothetical protein